MYSVLTVFRSFRVCCVQITGSFVNRDVEGASLFFGDQPWADGVWKTGQASAVS